ncbi:uncharacterized protein C11orf94 homolog [Egretta garzetta]|uniref:uncharacterized protein C11orf94 homolog n=1 Tax=Egretta garzetta TaxID=188379 RepID=UPI00163BDEAC|nr:uncharacterized protein C11orf94 homolog [Egretta garzetta]
MQGGLRAAGITQAGPGSPGPEAQAGGGGRQPGRGGGPASCPTPPVSQGCPGWFLCDLIVELVPGHAMGGWLLLLTLLLGAALPRPLRQRVSYSVPEDFSALLELPQQHFGLVDDYGIKPKQPRFRSRVAQERRAGLRRAGKSKRDELDLLEYYYNARL